MEEKPQDPPHSPQGHAGQPKFFSTMNGMIAGATGLVVALGGLVTAYTQIFDKKDAPPVATETAAPAGPVAAAADVPTEPAEDAPLLYEGDDASIEWVDEKWVVTTADGRNEYDDMYSKYEGYVLAYDREHDAYLRWPINGGLAEEGESDDGKLRWKDWIKFYPPEPAQNAAAADSAG